MDAKLMFDYQLEGMSTINMLTKCFVHIRYKDGNEYDYSYPQMKIKNTMSAPRFFIENTFTVRSFLDNLEALVSYEKPGRVLNKDKKETQTNKLRVSILKRLGKTIVVPVEEGEGLWTRYVQFADRVYWSIQQEVG